MPLPKSLGAYSDIAALLDQCLATKKNAAARFETPGQAIRWRQRAYYLRKLYIEDQERRGIIAPSCPYHTLQFRQDPANPTRILIEHNFAGKGISEITFDDMPEAAVTGVNFLEAADDDDPLLVAARLLAEKP